VISHDFADGINAVTFVLSQGGSRRAALRWLALVAVAPLFGALVGTALDISGALSGTCSRSTPGSSSTSERPICYPKRTPIHRVVA
jgi:zinc transporter ZupT